MHKFLRYFSLFVILLAIPLTIYLVGRATGFFGFAGGVPANLIVDAGQSFPDSHYAWKNLSQGGEESGDMVGSVVGKILPLHLNYIRIDHVFDMYDEGMIQSILATGAKPFISLSPLPEAPINWSDWETKVQNMITHISGTLGISNVYYEVGNEPDLFGGWKTYGNKNYFELYAHTINAANRVAGSVKPFKIGGPGTTQLYESWSTGFAKFVLANNLRLDFYSWHKYSMNIDNFENNATNAAVWLTEAGLPANTEIIISELGPDSNNNKVYDNGFGAIHAIATAVDLEDSVNKIFNFEIKDGPINRWGIITHDGATTKPRYSAFLFLNNMIGNRVKTTGQGSWVKSFTKLSGKTLRTIVVNYDPSGTHTEAVPMNYINLPSNNFRYRRIDYASGVVRDTQITTTGNSWNNLELMNPNTASIMEITFP